MEPEEAARDFAYKFFDTWADNDPDRITVEWLISKHPELSAQEAEVYRLFCRWHTISLRSCYGQGQIMYPKWKAWLAEVASLQ